MLREGRMQATTRLALGTVIALAAVNPASAEPLSHYGLGIQLGGGVEGFTNDELAETAGTGPAWNLRVIAGTRTAVSIEASYEGSAQAVDAFGLDNDALLIGTGLDAGARFSAWPGTTLSPYLSMGVGWRRYDLTRFTTNFSDVSQTDNVVELPVGVGAVLRFGGMMLDARVQFRAATGSDLMPRTGDPDGEHLAMHRWGVSGNLGYEF
jgi:hypothetical protein